MEADVERWGLHASLQALSLPALPSGGAEAAPGAAWDNTASGPVAAGKSAHCSHCAARGPLAHPSLHSLFPKAAHISQPALNLLYAPRGPLACLGFSTHYAPVSEATGAAVSPGEIWPGRDGGSGSPGQQRVCRSAPRRRLCGELRGLGC